MPSIGWFTPSRAREIDRQLRGLNQQPIGGSNDRGRPVDDPQGIPFRNDATTTAPAYGIMAVIGNTIQNGAELALVDRPSTTFYVDYLVNGPKDVAPNGFGYAQSRGPYRMLYDSASATPAWKDGWGVKVSSWKLTKGGPQLTIVRGIYSAPFELLSGPFFGSVTTLLGKASGSITARSGTTPGSGTMAIWANLAGTLTDTTMTTTALNMTATAITSGTYIQVKLIGGDFWVDAIEC